MAQPFLHLGDVGIVIKRIGRRGRAQRMGTDLESQSERVPSHQLVEPIRRYGIVEPTRAVIAHRAEDGALGVGGMMSFIKIVIEKLVSTGVERQVADPAAFGEDSQVRHPAARVNVP